MAEEVDWEEEAPEDEIEREREAEEALGAGRDRSGPRSGQPVRKVVEAKDPEDQHREAEAYREESQVLDPAGDARGRSEGC